MAFLVYALCALTGAACAGLLLIAFKRSGSRMLWWSAVCFVFLTVSNVLLVIDFFLLPDRMLWPLRHGISLAAISALLYGLIFEEP